METVKKEFGPNAKQQECIDAINGEIMVLAGPGTGKTYTLIERVKNMIINHKIEPEKILCLTFSEAAASEMHKRLVEKIGEIASNVNVYTYHGFCNELLNNFQDEFDFQSDTKIIDETNKRAFIKKCIDELKPKYFRTEMYDSYHYIPQIIKLIEEIKKNLLTKEEYFNNIKTHPDWFPNIEKNQEKIEEALKNNKKVAKSWQSEIESTEKKIGKAKELWDFYEMYSKMMLEAGFIDFNDMINFVLKKFKENSSFLEKIANSYDYFLVDEYQDTNKSQNVIVFNLVKASEKKNIFVVGDDDQIIYGFQGAQIDNIEKFLEEFPETRVICLEENMRSTQSILDLSYEVIKQDATRLEVNYNFSKFNIKKKLNAVNEDILKKEKNVVFNKYPDLDREYISIVEDIENLINSDNCPKDNQGKKKLSEIAILAKTNNELGVFAEMLKTRNIPFELKDGKSIFSIKSSILLFFYIKMLVNPNLHSDKVFEILLTEPFNVNHRDYEKLLHQKKLHRNEFFIDDIKQMDPSIWVEKDKIESLLKTYEYLKDYKNNESLKNIVLEIANKTGILSYFVKSEINKTENILGLKKLIDEAKNLEISDKTANLETFADYLNTAFESDIDILTDKSPVPLNAVQLITYHSSKGREFEHVYMPTLETRKWESDNKSPGNPPIPLAKILTEDEKKDLKRAERIKLLFVGITRAKHSLTLSCPEKISGKDKKITQLLASFIDSGLLETNVIENTDETFISDLIKLSSKKDFDYLNEFKEYLKTKIENLTLSATSINTYLKCPRQFLYAYLLELISKDTNKNSLSYGISVHYACERLLKQAIETGAYSSKEEFINWFEKDFAKRELSDKKTREDFLERARTNLDKFYVILTATPVKNLYMAEYRVEECKIGDVTIKGAIDRIEKNDDGTFGLYDYKTGKSKDKDIKDGGLHEDYLNQLRLYKYIFEKTTGNKVTKTGFLFPDAPTEGCERVLTEEDNVLIESKIIETYNKIKNLDFGPNSDDEKTCEYCSYKDFCRLDII